jgi:hypothetical protein
MNGMWFAAHVILYFQTRQRRQATFLAWENVYLVKASSSGRARSRAEALGRAECTDGKDLRVNGRAGQVGVWRGQKGDFLRGGSERR